MQFEPGAHPAQFLNNIHTQITTQIQPIPMAPIFSSKKYFFDHFVHFVIHSKSNKDVNSGGESNKAGKWFRTLLERPRKCSRRPGMLQDVAVPEMQRLCREVAGLAESLQEKFDEASRGGSGNGK